MRTAISQPPYISLSTGGKLTFMMIYLLTAIGLKAGGSSTVHIYTNNKCIRKNKMKQNTQNRTYIIKIHKHNSKNTYT